MKTNTLDLTNTRDAITSLELWIENYQDGLTKASKLRQFVLDLHYKYGYFDQRETQLFFAATHDLRNKLVKDNLVFRTRKMIYLLEDNLDNEQEEMLNNQIK